MFPVITLWSMQFSMTGIGIVFGIVVFLVSLWYYCHKHYLSFIQFYHMIPWFIWSIYFGGSYTAYVWLYHTFFPTSIVELSTIVMPPSYGFHPFGLVLWFMFFLIIFMKSQTSTVMIHKRIDALFVSMMSGICVIGIFFVFGDDVIGLSTDSRLSIYAFTPDSNVAKYNAVIPIWRVYSLICVISYVFYTRCKKHIPQKIWIGYIWWAFFLFWMSIATMWQIYPRRAILISLSDNLFIDSVNYWLFFCSLCFLCVFVFIHSMHRKKIIRRVLHFWMWQ